MKYTYLLFFLWFIGGLCIGIGLGSAGEQRWGQCEVVNMNEPLKFDLPESPWENSVVLHPDGTYRVWETKDGITWGYGDIILEVKDETTR